MITLVNCRSTALGTGANNVGALLKVLILAAFIIGGLMAASPIAAPIPVDPIVPTAEAPSVFSGVFAVAVVKVWFAFTGWGTIAVIGGEFKRPGRNIPLSIIIAIVSVTVIYLLMNIVFLRSGLPSAMLDADGNPTTTIGYFAAERLFPAWVAESLGMVIVVLLISTLLSIILTGGRWAYAMSQRGQFPAAFGRLNDRGAPVAALLLQGAITIALIAIFNISQLLLITGIIGFLTVSLAIGSVFVLRYKEPDAERPFKTPLYPLPPIIFIALSLWLAWRTIYEDWAVMLTSGLLVLFIAIFSAVIIRRGKSPALSDQ